MNPHQGLCLTRNTGISLAQGKYLTFLDSDDEYLKEHLQLHADCLSQKKETQALSSRLLVTGNPYVPDARDLTQTIHVDECTPSGTFFVRKDVLLKLGGFPIVSFGEDHALFKKLQAGGIPLEFSNLRTYKYHNIESDSLCNALLIQREEPLK